MGEKPDRTNRQLDLGFPEHHLVAPDRHRHALGLSLARPGTRSICSGAVVTAFRQRECIAACCRDVECQAKLDASGARRAERERSVDLDVSIAGNFRRNDWIPAGRGIPTRDQARPVDPDRPNLKAIAKPIKRTGDDEHLVELADPFL